MDGTDDMKAELILFTVILMSLWVFRRVRTDEAACRKLRKWRDAP
jgi:hypothetical protein